MAVLIDIETTKIRAVPRRMQIKRVLSKHKWNRNPSKISTNARY